jgi:hypothetical protein
MPRVETVFQYMVGGVIMEKKPFFWRKKMYLQEKMYGVRDGVREKRVDAEKTDGGLDLEDAASVPFVPIAPID